MRNPNRRSVAVGQTLALIAMGLATATPASAQFDKIKAKMKGEVTPKAAETAAPEAAAAPSTPREDNSTLVLTSEVVDRFLAGLRAAKAEREIAAKEDTPYGRYMRTKLAYDTAKAKCDQAQGTWPTRLTADEKLMKRNGALLDKMMAAAEKKDQKTQQMYADSMLYLVDPSCLVKQPEQPSDYWDAQRAVDVRAEQAALKASQLTPGQYSVTSERIYAILQGTEVPGGASASEKAAVTAKDPELKSLLGLRTAQEGRIAKQTPAPAPAPVSQPAPAPTAQGGMDAMNACMMQNVQTHQKEIEALGERAKAAQQAGDQATLMAISDSLQKLQMAGCGGGQ